MPSSGASARARSTSPVSCTMSASTPARLHRSTSSAASSSSPVKMSVFMATKAFTPCRWQKATTSGSSASVKFSARSRALKRGSPK